MTHSVSGGVRVLLRLEGLCILAASVLAYAEFGSDWALLLCSFLLQICLLLAILLARRWEPFRIMLRIPLSAPYWYWLRVSSFTQLPSPLELSGWLTLALIVPWVMASNTPQDSSLPTWVSLAGNADT